jgi:ABC-type polysaccharide/polyol phosphate export permease
VTGERLDEVETSTHGGTGTDPPTAPSGDEPAALGAAATLPEERRVRARRRQRREDRRGRRVASGASSTARPDEPTSAAEGYSDTEYVFEADAPPSTPIVPYVRELWGRRRFMVELARAELRGKHSSTALGRLWGILDPLFQAAIYYMLFTIIRRGARPTEFLHVLIAGIFLFQLALSAITEGGRSIRKSKSLMLNSTFPRALFPLTTVCLAVMRFGPAVPVYAAFHLGLQAPVGWGLLLLPALFAIQVVLMLGLALLVSTLVVLFKDAGNVVQYIGRVLFFVTPVIYPLDSIPSDIRDLISWQPFFALFACYQEVFDGRTPGLSLVIQAVLWAGGLLIVGSRVFLRHERELAIRL